jgi:hypothetical protein
MTLGLIVSPVNAIFKGRMYGRRNEIVTVADSEGGGQGGMKKQRRERMN